MYIRRKVIKGHTYYYLVEGRRHGGKVKQKVIRYLGKHPGAQVAPAATHVPECAVSPQEILTVRLPELDGTDIERPVAHAVVALLDEHPVSSGFHQALNQRWTVVFDGEISTRAVRAAHAAGLEVSTREAPQGTGRILTDVSLPNVSATQLEEATRVFDTCAVLYTGMRKTQRTTQRPSQTVPESRRFTGKAFRAESDLIVKGNTARGIVDFEADELGNLHIRQQAAALGIHLEDIPEKDVVWVTTSLKAAKWYGDNAKEVKLPKHAFVLAEDGDGGFLVYRGDRNFFTQPAAKGRRS